MRLDPPKQRFTPHERKVCLLAILLLTLLVLPSLNSVRHYLVDNGFVAHHTSTKDKAWQLAKSLALAPAKWLAAEKELPVIKIDIKYQDWLKLESDRKTAFTQGKIPEIRHEVTALIYYQQNKFPAKIRLQGDMLDHINKTKRWSLKVSLKKKQAIFESRKFSLLATSVRGHQGASLFAKSLAIANFDIISPKHIPVRVVLNGNDWGVMFFEQAFSQSLLAVNNRTEGLIARLDLVAESIDENGQVTRLLKPRVLQRKTILGNSSLAKQRKIALALLNDFLSGNRSASDVFDAKRLAQYLAMVDLWGAWHALTWNNWRWYYNPHTAKLEPIQSDVAVTPAAHIWLMQPPSQTFEITKAMLNDPQVKAHYLASKSTLMKLLNEQIIPQLSRYEQQLTQLLHSDSPLISPFNFDVMQRQAHCWSTSYQVDGCRSIKPVSEKLHKQLNVFKTQPNWDLVSRVYEHQGQVVWLVKNNDNISLIIKEVQGVTTYDEITKLDEINDDLPLKLFPGQTTTINLPKNVVTLKVSAGLAGKKIAPFIFNKNVRSLSFVPRPYEPRNSIFLYSEFIKRTKGEWHVQVGTWHINSYLVTPSNTKVVIPAGTHLTFSKNAGLMVFGSIQVYGNKNNPVIFTKHQADSKWSGLSVFAASAETEHVINHLKIHFASSPKLGLWQPRGAIYFVKGIVNMQSVEITDNQSEDGLNIINAVVIIDGLTIKNTLSDAFDCDFCTGEVNNSQFINIGSRSGGDGLDISGSNLKLTGAKFTQVRDKAISAGERSQLHVIDATFNDVNFAIVAKDDSTVIAENITASNIHHMALMSYSKKRIFGPAVMKVTKYSCADLNCQNKSVAELGSRLVVNGLEIRSQAIDVNNLYNTIMKSDKPK